MTFGEMFDYTNRFNNIIHSSSANDVKDMRLANLMSDLESAYQIPMLSNNDFEMQNTELMQLYRTVSDERSF